MLRLLGDPIGLRTAGAAIFAFMPVMIVPAIMILGANVTVLGLARLASKQLTGASVGLENLLLAAGLLLLALLAAVPLLFMGLSKLVLALVAFSRFWVEIYPIPQDTVLDRSAIASMIQPRAVLEKINQKGKFISAYLFYVSILLSGPLSILLILVGIKFVLVGSDPANLFAWQTIEDKFLWAIFALVGSYIISVSMLVLPFGAFSEESAWRTALTTFSLAFRSFPQCLVLCAIVSLEEMIVAGPQFIWKTGSALGIFGVEEDFWPAMLSLVWQIIAGLVTFPAMVILFSEVWKYSTDERLAPLEMPSIEG